MNKNSKHKLLAITFLLSLLSIYSMYAALIPVVQATEPNIQDKAMAVLSDVVGINTESYATNLNSQVDKEYRGLTEKEVNLYFSSEQSQLRASCTFVNNNLHLIYISDYEGTPSLKRSSANTADMAKGCLKEYENYAGDAFYGGLASMLDMIDAGANSTKIVGNIKLDVLNLGNIVDYTWTYADDNGVIAQLKSVLLSYEGGRLKSFLNNWPLYTIAGTAKISIEEATSIAVEASKNFSYELNTDNGTMTVSGFKVAPESLSHQALSYLNFPDQNTARGGDPFTLYPSWYVPLGFDKFYPGDVTGMTVTIWADTGEVSSTSPMVCDIGSQSTVEGEIDTEIEQGSTILSSSTAISGSIVIAAIFIVAGCLFLTRRNESTSACMRKLFHPKFWGIMLIASIVFSSVLITIPMANATGSDLIRSKAMIYASLHDQVDNEPDAAEEVTDYIEQCFLENGYSTTNLCGEGTTVSNVMNYTQSSENNFGRVAAFHFGHYYDPYESYQDNNGVPVCADDISDYTESQKHFFVWIWACKQAYNASYRMPVAWTHREPGTGGYMSNDGYFTTDSGDHCFITFDGGSPQIGNSSGTFNCSETGPLKNFIMLFYDYALEEVSGGGYTVKGSLDRASLDFFDCNYENCVISDWYHGAWWPGPEPEATYYPGRMLVFGNGDIKLYQPQLYLSARDTNNNQVLPTFTIDGYPFSTQYVRLVPGAHIINVSDETGYVFDHFNYLGNNYNRPLYTIVLDGPLTAYYNIHVNAPSVSGPTTGDIDTSYQFSASTTDYYGHDVRYTFDWGDGSNQDVTGYISSGATAYMNHSWSSGGLWDVKVKAQCYNTGVESSWSNAHTINIGNTLLWLSVDAYDDFYLDELYPDVYVDSNWVGTAPLYVQVSEGYHDIGVTNYVWNQNQEFGDYFDHFSPGSYSQNPSYMYISSDTELTAWYIQEGK